jgi:hypothetical protein
LLPAAGHRLKLPPQVETLRPVDDAVLDPRRRRLPEDVDRLLAYREVHRSRPRNGEGRGLSVPHTERLSAARAEDPIRV